VYVLEAETDAIALTQYGFEPCVSLTAGAGNAAKLIKKCKDDFIDFDEILIVTDMEEKGNEAAIAIAAELGPYRCKRVELSFKDANKCLEEGVPVSEITDAIKKSALFAKPVIQHISEYRDLLTTSFDPNIIRGISTGYESLDDHMVGLAPGEITIFTGQKGSGKSTLVDAIALSVASRNYPVMVSSPEMPMDQTIQKFISMQSRSLILDLNDDERFQSFEELSEYPIYLHQQFGRLPFELLIDPIEYGVRKYGFRVIVLDHLVFYIGEPKTEWEERRHIEKTMYQIDEVTKRLQISTMLVVHPKKARTTTGGRLIQADLGDLKGSSEIDNLASNVARVARQRNEARINTGLDKSIITFLKVRNIHGKEGSTKLRYYPNELRYERWTKEDSKEDKEMQDDAKRSKKKSATTKNQEKLF